MAQTFATGGPKAAARGASNTGNAVNAGEREDLANFISMISRDETPFLSSIGKTKATAVFHEWQTDELAAPTSAPVAEGVSYSTQNSAQANEPFRTRLGNYTQINSKTVTVTGTKRAVDQAGVADEYAYQLKKRGTELRRDVEFDLVTDQFSAGQGAVPDFDFDIPGLESGDGVYSITVDDRTASSTNTIVDFSINYCRQSAVTLAWNWREDDVLTGSDSVDISSEDTDCDNTATSSIEVLSSATIILCASTHQTGIGVVPPLCVEFPADLSIQIPEFQDRVCSLTQLQGCLINAGLFLFRPNPQNISAVIQTAQGFETKFPFAYISQMRTILATSLGTEEEFQLGVSATSSYLTIDIPILNTGDIEDNPYLDWDFLYTLMRWSVYIWFGLFVYRVAVTFRMKEV